MWTTKFINNSPFWFYIFHVWFGTFDHGILTERCTRSILATTYSLRICCEIYFKFHENMSLVRRNLIIWNRSHRIIQVNGCNHDLFDSFPDLEHNFNVDFLHSRIQFAKLKRKKNFKTMHSSKQSKREKSVKLTEQTKRVRNFVWMPL